MTTQKTERISAWVTPELKAHIEQVLNQRRKSDKSYTLADLLREAMRNTIDNEDEIMGSKAHQIKTFKRVAEDLQLRIDDLEWHLALLLNVNIQLVAIVSALELKHLQQKEVDPQKLLEIAIRSAASEKGLTMLHQMLELAKVGQK